MSSGKLEEVMHEMKKRSFKHIFHSITNTEVEEESIDVVALTDVFDVLTDKERNIKMRELNTIQKVEKLNKVYAVGEKGPGNAYHEYHIQLNDYMYCSIVFQKGPRKEADSIHGIIDTDLLEIVRDRLKGFQSGEFATQDNEKALEHIEIALMYMNKRVMDRYERNVLGTNEK